MAQSIIGKARIAGISTCVPAQKIDNIEDTKGFSKTEVRKIESDLKTLEQTHSKLKRSGKHPKKDLNRLKLMIDNHKKKLKSLK